MARTAISPLGLTIVLAWVLPLVACGTSGTPAAPATPSQPGTELIIVVDDGGGAKTTWKLSCDPAGGDHPTAEDACRALAEHGATALPAVAKDQVCGQQYGGPETATITGTWQGKPVASSLSRKDSCEIARWEALRPVFSA